jgi:hypothetical protein
LEDFPKIFEQKLAASEQVPVSDWVQQALDKAQKLEVAPYEKTLANKLIQKAFTFVSEKHYSLGNVLAAAFDLFIATQYYRSVAHTGWYYCPKDAPMLFYPFTNVCPRCMLAGEFHFEEANKPESGAIGQATSRLLSVFLNQLFERTGRKLTIYRGSEPVDMLIYDERENVVLLVEIKAAPLTTLALAVASDEMLVLSEEGILTPITTHSSSNNPSLSATELLLFTPTKQGNDRSYRFVHLGKIDVHNTIWTYGSVEQALDQDSNFFEEYLQFWLEAFESYKENYRASRRGQQFKSNTTFWFTNACGQPYPRPNDWPKRSGTGYRSVSDGKTSVGMDRTDDIKKGIYQVLKVGAESKPNSSGFKVKTALISNIHAVRHYDEYLQSLEDVVWLIDKSQKAKMVNDLPDDTPVYSLFDGIITFTESHIRDEWIKENFIF